VRLSNGVQYPRVGLGMFRLQDPSLVSSALQAGYVLFDTAKVYGNEKFLKDLVVTPPTYPTAPFHSTPGDGTPTDIGKVVIESGGCEVSAGGAVGAARTFMVQTKLWRTQHGRAGASHLLDR
jgi:diketogulonate reductase-like aldo/keto reductase